MTTRDQVSWPPAPVTGERVRLRAATDVDRSTAIELLTSAAVRQHLGGPLSDADAADVMSGPIGQVPGSFVVALAENDSMIGSIGFSRRDADRPGHLSRAGNELEISYTLLPQHWGRGFATESVQLALDWARAGYDDDSVIACTQAANTKSLSLLHRSGFQTIKGFSEFGADQLLLAVRQSRG